VGKREGHDASEFYARFVPPEITNDDTVQPFPAFDDPFFVGDARHMAQIPDNSVALVVTSPPYFVGKEYEADVARGEIPATYEEYLRLLTDVFAECKRVLEPGGRIAVNVANLGRKPYRSLSSDVVGILQDGLGMLLRGEVIWSKQEGNSGSCAWGAFRKPTNPVLRDTTERVIIASKGRFDRARSVDQRAAEGLPHQPTVTSDEFMDATLDVWRLPAESAKRVGHPAPFPVQLPERLIRLYTWADDVVLDPFMGSGSTLVAAARNGRRYAGFDLDPTYAELARQRVADALAGRADDDAAGGSAFDLADELGGTTLAIAERWLADRGFTVEAAKFKARGLAATFDFLVRDADGLPYLVDVSGGFTTNRTGLSRVDTALRSVGRAALVSQRGDALAAQLAAPPRVLLVSTDLAAHNNDADRTVRGATPALVFDVIELLDPSGAERLTAYAAGGVDQPLEGFWSRRDLP